MQRLGWWGRAKTGAGILLAMVGDEEIGEDDIEKLKGGDVLESSFGEFAAHSPALYESVIDALKDIYDPEIPVNIYDLGLIYGVEITPDHHAFVKMTLTTPHCPVAESMPGEVELRVSTVPGIATADVNLVWDPPWDPAKMTDEARLELGML